MSDHNDDASTRETANEPIGEEVEDVVEAIVSDASPYESSEKNGGTENVDRSGDEALDDDDSFTA